MKSWIVAGVVLVGFGVLFVLRGTGERAVFEGVDGGRSDAAEGGTVFWGDASASPLPVSGTETFRDPSLPTGEGQVSSSPSFLSSSGSSREVRLANARLFVRVQGHGDWRRVGPVAEAHVQLFVGAKQAIAEAWTDDEGQASLGGLRREGHYRLHVARPGFHPATVYVDMKASARGDAVPVLLERIDPGHGTIRAELFVNGAPEERLRGGVLDGSELRSSFYYGDPGYELRGVPAGLHRVFALPVGWGAL